MADVKKIYGNPVCDETARNTANGKYSKPQSGIPEDDLSDDVKAKLNASGGSTLTETDISAMGFTKNTGNYSKPSSGIPESDLSDEIKSKLNSNLRSEQITALNAMFRKTMFIEDKDHSVYDNEYRYFCNAFNIPYGSDVEAKVISGELRLIDIASATAKIQNSILIIGGGE